MLITAALTPDLAVFVAGHSAGAMTVVLEAARVDLTDRPAVAAALVGRGFSRSTIGACADRAVALLGGAPATAAETSGRASEQAVRQ